jgi:hypothetical protein
MVRKRDRVIGTLLVWIGVLISTSMVLDRLNYARLDLQNNWYYTGGVLTGVSSEEANEILQNVQSISTEIYFQTQNFVKAELFTYWPYFLLIIGLLLAAGVVSTLFIWRSVIVPAEVREMIAANDYGESQPARSLATLLDDDGELVPLEDDPQPATNHRSAP